MTDGTTALAGAIARRQLGGKCLKCGAELPDDQFICVGCYDENPAADRAPAVKPWPADWPKRAILDLENFIGEPLEAARRVLGKSASDGTIAIIGDRGRGKTVMATWLADQRRLSGRSPGTYVRAHDLFATIRRAWHPQSKETEWAVLERYRTTPFLVIDEFQERSESEWENRTLVNILDHRHASMKPTVLIANLAIDAFAAQLGPSLIDRLGQTGGIVDCSWQNLRR